VPVTPQNLRLAPWWHLNHLKYLKLMPSAGIPFGPTQRKNARPSQSTTAARHNPGQKPWPDLTLPVPPSISQERWAQFVDDCGRFLDQGWATHAGGLGWGPLDLFGCDRERPPADDDHAGLLWRVEGGKLVIMSAYSAIIETTTGQQRLFHRRNNRPGELALAWEMTPGEIKA